MNCEMKTKFLLTYQNAANVYSKAVSDLAKGVGIASREQYDRKKIAAANARLVAEQARSDFETHILEHGCDNRHDKFLNEAVAQVRPKRAI